MSKRKTMKAVVVREERYARMMPKLASQQTCSGKKRNNRLLIDAIPFS